MKKLFRWAVAMVVLEVTTFSAAYMISHSYEAAAFTAAAFTAAAFVTFATFATFAAVAAVAAAFTAVAFVAFVATFATFVAAVAAFAVVFAVVFAVAAFTAVAFAKEEKNLSLWRVLMVLTGEAGSIVGWMLLFPSLLSGAVLVLAIGVGVMTLAAFVGVREPKNATRWWLDSRSSS